jgi:AcrR family transcriptional regulator
MIEESIMARTTTITNNQILQAAQVEFLEHGIRATTVGIARRAGVSQGILFHRFGSKEALFAAAMNVGNDANNQTRQSDLRDRVGKGSVNETLIKIGEILLDRFFNTVPNQIMAWANPGSKRGESMANQYRERGVRGQKVLVEYLRAEARLKRIRLVDPFVVAQTFGGALWFFAFEQVTGAKLRGPDKPPSRSEFVHQLVSILWKGLRP